EGEFSMNFDEYFAPELQRLEEARDEGLVVLDSAEIRVTALGRIFIRNVAMAFDRYLHEQQMDRRPLFSKTLRSAAPMKNPPQVAVIGAGISGLACAYRLQQLGVDVAVFESNSAAGGMIDSVERDGLLFEAGPQSFQGTPALLELIRKLGLEAQLQKADPRAPRYVLLHGHLRKIPMSPQALLASTLLNPVSRWKIASEPFKKSQPPTEEESVAAFVRRKFGHEILEYLVAPFV